MRPRHLARIAGISAWIILGTSPLCPAGWFDAGAGKIVVVQGTSSVRDPAEKPLATRLARQMDNWLTGIGAPHKMISDEEVSPWRLWRARAVILPYNPHPTARELKLYQGVVDSGGILLVFYGMDPGLATLMGLKVGTYQAAPSKSRWASFEFDRTTLSGLPPRVHQSSQHLVPALPDTGTAQIIAHWTDARGTRTPEPAWLQSKAGFWMTHILQPGDDARKRQMLLAMLATVIPGLWTQAAEYQLSLRRPFGEYDTLKAACRALSHDLPSLPKAAKAQDAYAAAQAWLAELTRQYARQNLTRSFSVRGVWLDEGPCPIPEAWPAIEANLQRLDLDTVFLHAGNPLTLRTSAQQLPGETRTARQYDRDTRPNLHAWLSCMNLEGATPEQLAPLRAENRLQVSDAGETLNWLCPTHPRNHTLLVETATRLARDTTYTGIHLDYIRYLNSRTCFCPGCRQRFEQFLGHPVNRWPADARAGLLTRAYQNWRANRISACVEAMRKAIRGIAPAMQVSAAVYGATPGCLTSVGQDWPNWLEQDLVDFVCPMNYTADLAAFQTLLDTQCALPFKSRIIPGVGISSSQSQLSPDQTTAQLIRVQKAGFAGFALFEYHHGMAVPGGDSGTRSQEPGVSIQESE